MAMHTQNLQADLRASLFVADPDASGDPLGSSRVTLIGSVVRIPEPELATARTEYLAAYPDSKYWVDFDDFFFYRMDVLDIYYVGGFGVMGWVPASEYSGAQPDPLVESKNEIIRHMNADHKDGLILLGKRFAGIEAQEANMTSVDRLGFNLRLKTKDGVKGVRIAFLREVRDPAQTREVLVEMVQQARQGSTAAPAVRLAQIDGLKAFGKLIRIERPRTRNDSRGHAALRPLHRYSGMTSASQSARQSTARVQRAARERADDEARRIQWQRLYDVRNQYIDWQAFYLWVRSILEVEDGIPNWLVEILNDRCAGFLETQKSLTSNAARKRPIALCLEDWIDDNIFGFAKQEGWFFAVTYYAVREPRYQRAEVCWSECVEKWKKAKPIRYPSFEEWKALAEQCDETAHLVAGERKARASVKLVDPGRLSEAVARYIDYEAFAYWARPALEGGSELPPEVVRELERRFPGYLQTAPEPLARKKSGAARDWEHLMLWVGDRFFQDARTEGWFDAILIQVRSHPRAIRTVEFADHCDEVWSSQVPDPYPSFEDWRREADTYVEPAGSDPRRTGGA